MPRLPSRRAWLKTAAAGAAGVFASPFLGRAAEVAAAAASSATKKKILFFCRSEDYPHDSVTPSLQNPTALPFGTAAFKKAVETAGYDLTISKDGAVFNPDKIGAFDAFVFYTTGDLTQPETARNKTERTPPMTPEGKAALLRAIDDGKGFMGLHCATDTFHRQDPNTLTRLVRPASADDVDPYIAMLGGEFKIHGDQQDATIRIADPNFPGLKDLKEFTFTEEWYSLYNLAPDLHVILVQDTTTMSYRGQREAPYQRDPYPETWARMQNQGRVFYSSMGHRQDVWDGPIFQQVFLAGLAWAAGLVKADIPPNLATACPALMKAAAAQAVLPKA